MQDLAWKRVINDEGRDPSDAASSCALRRAFEPLVAARRTNAPYVIAQLGLSLDGRIATESGESRYINGKDALKHLHRIRALTDAVIVGAGTVEADDPQLTVRHCAGADPARVVIDPNGRIGCHAKVWEPTGARRIVIGGANDLPDGVERVRIACTDAGLSVDTVMARLAEIGLRRVLVEGGADTLGRFLAAGAVDGLHLLYGRVIIGSGKQGLDLPPITSLNDAARPRTDTHVFDDGDVLIACHFDRN